MTTDLLKNENLSLYSLDNKTPPDWFAVYMLSADGAARLGEKFSLLYSLFGGASTNSVVPEDYKLYIGGTHSVLENSFPFLGLNFLELSGTHALVLRAGLQYNMDNNMVLQLLANAGKVERSFDDLLERSGMHTGAGFTWGWHTPLGPLEYTLSYGNHRREFISSLNIGYRF